MTEEIRFLSRLMWVTPLFDWINGETLRMRIERMYIVGVSDNRYLVNAHDKLAQKIKMLQSMGLAFTLLGAAVIMKVLREVTKNNLPILLAFWPVLFVAAIGEYSNMHRLSRLEYEPKFGAIMGRLFFVTSLTATNYINSYLENGKLLFFLFGGVFVFG